MGGGKGINDTVNDLVEISNVKTYATPQSSAKVFGATFSSPAMGGGKGINDTVDDLVEVSNVKADDTA